MERRGRVYLLYSFFAGTLALLIGSSALLVVSMPFSSRDLSAARARWAARPFSHYRLALKYGTLGYCRQIVEVDRERVVAELENTCSKPAPTVSELFNRIERDLKTLSGSCGPNGCECDGTVVVVADYDSTLGYPQAKRVFLEPRMRWRFPQYWRNRLRTGACTSREMVKENITVVSLTPLT
jgi:hypothetical protein